MAVLDSLKNMITSFQNDGPYCRFIHGTISSGVTQANSTSGRINCARMSKVLTLPSSFGAGIKGVKFTNIHGHANSDRCHLIVGIEILLGTLVVGGSFTGGGLIAQREVEGELIQPATILNFVTVSANVTGTPALTITYTNQDGTTSRSATPTLPAAPVADSAFFLNRHLQGGDSGIRQVTNMSQTGGSAGTVEVRGLLPLKIIECHGSGSTHIPQMVDAVMPNYLGLASDKIAMYKMGDGVTGGGTFAALGVYGLAER